MARPGWLLGGVTAALTGLVLWSLTRNGATEEAARMVVRGTAKIAVLLFSLAFSASSLHSLAASTPTKWLLRNRRYLGLSFALAMTVHLLALVALWRWFPDPFIAEVDTVTLVGGGLAYGFMFALAATSSDAAFRWLGGRHWRRLHTIGSYYIWLIFAPNYIPRATESPEFVPYAAALVVSLGLRIARRARGGARE